MNQGIVASPDCFDVPPSVFGKLRQETKFLKRTRSKESYGNGELGTSTVMTWTGELSDIFPFVLED